MLLGINMCNQQWNNNNKVTPVYVQINIYIYIHAHLYFFSHLHILSHCSYIFIDSFSFYIDTRADYKVK